MFDFGLAGRVALVTGASQGLGLEVAHAFARQGAHVVIAARSKERLEAAAAAINAAGGGAAVAVQTDVTSDAEVARFVEAAAARFGRIDILVTNASTPTRTSPPDRLDATADAFAYHFNVKMLGAVRTSQAALPHMRRQRWGRIVTIGGGAARTVGSGPSTAGAANSALANYSKGLSELVGPHGITVNCIHPSGLQATRYEAHIAEAMEQFGITREEAHRRTVAGVPIGRLPQSEDVAAAVLFFCSNQAGAITGQTISVDGGRGRGVIY